MKKERMFSCVFAVCMAPGLVAFASADAPTAEAASVAHVAALLDTWKDGDGAAIKAELDAILAADPRSAAAHREYARYQIKHGYDDATGVLDPAAIVLAQQSLDRALAISPSFAEAYVLQGHVYWLQKQPDKARAALARAEAIGTRDPWLDLNWAEVLMDAREYAAAVPRCKRILASSTTSDTMKWMADDCLIRSYRGMDRMDDAKAAHRARIARLPGDAFAYGNYANFQLCLDEPEDAVKSVQQALRLKVYPNAMTILAAARYRIWAREVNAKRPLKAAAAWEEANHAPVADPAAVVGAACRGPFLVLPTLRALRDTGRGVRITPMLAVLAVAQDAGDADAGDGDGDGIPGIFVMKVAATGRQGDELYLNSEADYRDQRNLTVHITPTMATAFNKLHGVDLDAMLKGQYISVVGTARRTRIDFTMNGQPTGRFYYQTQVVVWDPTDVRIEDPNQPLAPPPAPTKPAVDA